MANSNDKYGTTPNVRTVDKIINLLLKRYQVGWVGSARVLHDENLWATKRVYRRVIPVRLLAEWQHSFLVRVAQARHTDGQQAHQHQLRAIGIRLTTEATVGHVLSVTSKVYSRAPESSAACT